jgi:uncharacterized protein
MNNKIENVEDQELHNKTKISIASNIKYLVVGLLFGIIFVKAEIVSWYRIQEMFRFQSFHMFGVIGSAVFTGLISIFIINKFKIKTLSGDKILITKKEYTMATFMEV